VAKVFLIPHVISSANPMLSRATARKFIAFLFILSPNPTGGVLNNSLYFSG